jgi:HK97 family phage major capsid protein
MRTIEEITAAMTALVDGAADRSLTDDEVTAYEGLENELRGVQRGVQRSEEIRARNAAYNSVTIPAGVPRTRASDPDAPSDLDLAFRAYLRTGIPNNDISGLAVTNAQGEGSSAGGGYLVPTTFQEKIVDRMVAYGGLATEVETITTTTGGPLDFATLDDTANTGSISAEHAAPASGADLVFGKKSLGAYRYTSAGAGSNLPVRVSTALIRDAAVNIENIVADKLAERIYRKQAAHWCTGTGVAEPLGLVADSLTADNDLDTADTPDYEDLVETEDLLDPAYEPGAKWIMRKNTWSQLRLIVDLNGRPILQDSTDGITGRPQRSLLGYPVVIDQAMPLLSSAGITLPIAFGDFRKAYVRRNVGTVSILVNPYARMKEGEIEYHGEMYADGLIQNRNAYVIVRNNT